MKASITKITSDVAALLNRSLALECEPEESPFPDFSFQVALMAPGILAGLLLSSPKVLIDGWRRLDGAIQIDDNGSATLQLPDDFLILGSVKLSGWSRSVDTLAAENNTLRLLQASDVEGVRACSQRPATAVETGGPGGRVLRMYGAGNDDTLEEGWYLPVPAFAGDTLEVPPAIYYQLVKEIAGAIAAG